MNKSQLNHIEEENKFDPALEKLAQMDSSELKSLLEYCDYCINEIKIVFASFRKKKTTL